MVVNRMQINEIRELSTPQMVEKEQEFKKELFNLRFQLATGQLENTAQLKYVRKTIARIKTVLREQELASK